MTSKHICAPLAFAALLAAASVGIAADDATLRLAPAVRKLFDLDLTAFYRGAAIQGAPAIMLPEPQRDGFAAAEAPFAFSTPAWSQPGAFGHILDLPPASR